MVGLGIFLFCFQSIGFEGSLVGLLHLGTQDPELELSMVVLIRIPGFRFQA